MGFVLPYQTTTTFLANLLDYSNQETWKRVDDIYRPVIQAYAMRAGLSREDAGEVAQEILYQVCRDLKTGYDRGRGRLRAWIFRIAKNRVMDVKRSRRAQSTIMTAGSVNLEEMVDPDGVDSVWAMEESRSLIHHAMTRMAHRRRLQEKTLQAFYLLMFEGKKAPEVAKELEMTVASVYVAKNRCLSHLRAVFMELDWTV